MKRHDNDPSVPVSSGEPACRVTRRGVLKTLGAAAAVAAIPELPARAEEPRSLPKPKAPDHKTPERPVTAIVLGAGNRGNVYASYSGRYPKELKIVGVAEPIPHRIERFADTYGVADNRRWISKACSTSSAVHSPRAMAIFPKGS